jgi:hypothetical protein
MQGGGGMPDIESLKNDPEMRKMWVAAFRFASHDRRAY